MLGVIIANYEAFKYFTGKGGGAPSPPSPVYLEKKDIVVLMDKKFTKFNDEVKDLIKRRDDTLELESKFNTLENSFQLKLGKALAKLSKENNPNSLEAAFVNMLNNVFSPSPVVDVTPPKVINNTSEPISLDNSPEIKEQISKAISTGKIKVEKIPIDDKTETI